MGRSAQKILPQLFLEVLGIHFFLHYMNISRNKIKGTLMFHVLFYLKHIKDIESKSIWGVAFTCSNPCMTLAGHTEDGKAYLCS